MGSGEKIVSYKNEGLTSQYATTEHWISVLEFYHIELQFLKKLISKYFIWLTKEDTIDRAKKLGNKLVKLEQTHAELNSSVSAIFTKISKAIDLKKENEDGDVTKGFGQIQIELAQFVKKYRKLRKKTFRLVEGSLVSEKAQHLLSSYPSETNIKDIENNNLEFSDSLSNEN